MRCPAAGVESKIGKATPAHWYQDSAALSQVVCHFIEPSAIKPVIIANISNSKWLMLNIKYKLFIRK
jgi:hypothetical protein